MKDIFHRDPASFRDPEGTVFLSGGKVYRVLSEGALRQWHEFRGTAAAAALFADGTLVETTEVEEDGKTLLEHARVPLISYFYEWSFDMLKDAALLTLDITEKLLESGFILKDATPFNIQFLGSRPVFIDIGSIVEYEETEGWVGYAQFLETFMYPLMIASLRNVSFQPFLRSHIDGLPMEFMRSMFGWMDIFKPGVFGDILLRDIVAARTKRRAGQNANIGGADLKVPRETVTNNIRRLSGLIGKLLKSDDESVWKDYTETRPYSDADIEQKREFVEGVLKIGHGVVWDLGANTGEFSFAAAPHAGQVLAIESDHGAANLIYRQAKESGVANINVIVDDLVNPSPHMGFALEERGALFSRSKPDLVLALALIHHLVLTRSVPMEMLIGWMRGLCPKWVFEFAHEGDPMVEFLIKAKLGRTHPYSRGEFETALSKSFRVLERLELGGADRTLYLAEGI